MTSYFQDGGHDVISRRKVLPSGECTRSLCLAHMTYSSSVRQLPTITSVYSSWTWSILHSYLWWCYLVTGCHFSGERKLF